MPRALLLLAALTLAACASDESQTYEPIAADAVTPPEASGAEGAVPPAADHGTASIGEAATYTCAEGGFSVAPAGGGAVALTLEDGERTLQPKGGQVGVFAGDGVELWIADEGAFVIRDGAFVLNDCAEATDA